MPAILLLLLLTGCAMVEQAEGVALDRAKRPIVVTIYHTKF